MKRPKFTIIYLSFADPGEKIAVRNGTIYGAGKYPSAAKETNITVLEGDSPPVGVVLRGATTVSSCGDVSLSARESTGGASRSFTYLWMVYPTDNTNLTDALSGEHSYFINVLFQLNNISAQPISK